jgi:hypothetical protein
MQKRLDRAPQASRLRRQTVEHPFGTLKSWMGATHFLTKTLSAEAIGESIRVRRCAPQSWMLGEGWNCWIPSASSRSRWAGSRRIH